MKSITGKTLMPIELDDQTVYERCTILLGEHNSSTFINPHKSTFIDCTFRGKQANFVSTCNFERCSFPDKVNIGADDDDFEIAISRFKRDFNALSVSLLERAFNVAILNENILRNNNNLDPEDPDYDPYELEKLWPPDYRTCYQPKDPYGSGFLGENVDQLNKIGIDVLDLTRAGEGIILMLFDTGGNYNRRFWYPMYRKIFWGYQN